jgi:maleate cis-trans isomerase
MTLEEGARMAMDVGREAGNAVSAAEVIYVPGGAALSLHVIPILEREFGKPVLTSLAAELWHGLVQAGVTPPIDGCGTLLAGAWKP